jgi:hypothetical protein
MFSSVALISNHMCVNNLWFLCLKSYIVSVKSIQSSLEMTCFVSKVSCKVRNVMNTFPRTNIVVKFVELLLLICNTFFLRDMNPIYV